MMASFTAVWTIALCCCAIGAHGTAMASQADQPGVAAPVDAHACCQTPLPADDPAPEAPAPADHDCDCSADSLSQINQGRQQTLRPATLVLPALDLFPFIDIASITAPPTASAHLPSHAPPVSPGAQSLFAQACLLTT